MTTYNDLSVIEASYIRMPLLMSRFLSDGSGADVRRHQSIAGRVFQCCRAPIADVGVADCDAYSAVSLSVISETLQSAAC